MNKLERNLYLAGLSQFFPKILVRELLDNFIIEELKSLQKKELKEKIPERFRQKLSDWQNFDIEKLEKVLEKNKIRMISFLDDSYPLALSEIPDKPFVVFVKGKFEPDQYCVSVVGSRNSSQYGMRMTSRITEEIAKAGVTVVSGLALGIDGAAHRACLEVGGKTVAVLANGLNAIYPVSHHRLGMQILENGGALVSEYLPGIEPLKHQFLERNRIIAGMSMGTVVVEANEKSGALTTARLALEYGRSVFAVPGDAERLQSAGTNNLIKQGAVPVWKGEDVLKELNVSTLKVDLEKPKLRLELQNVLDLLGQEPTHVDNLALELGLDISKINVILVELELKGYVRNVGGMQFIKHD